VIKKTKSSKEKENYQNQKKDKVINSLTLIYCNYTFTDSLSVLMMHFFFHSRLQGKRSFFILYILPTHHKPLIKNYHKFLHNASQEKQP
jgi:hypothetical protein